MAYAIKIIHNLLPHVSYVSTLLTRLTLHFLHRNWNATLTRWSIDTWERIPHGVIGKASGKHSCEHVLRQRDVTSNTVCDLDW